MQRSYLPAASIAFALMLQTPIALAQGTDAATTPPIQATTPAPAATTTAPAGTTQTAAPATATPAAGATATTPSADSKKTTEKKPAKKKQMTRQQEIDHSIDTGTVPSRYRSSVPKEYQHYIPFDKK
ncbi:hypothetical protein Q3C01_31185 [Bradyrhizobium sp. UFLA05-109]